MTSKNNPHLETFDEVKISSKNIKADMDDNDLFEEAYDAADSVINTVIKMQAALKNNNPLFNAEAAAYHYLGITGTYEQMKNEAPKKIASILFKIFKAQRDKLAETGDFTDKKVKIENSINVKLLKIKKDEYDNLKDVIGIQDTKRRKHKIEELFELDTTKVVIKTKKYGFLETFEIPKYASDKVLKGKKVKVTNGKEYYLVSADEYKKILREINRPFNLERYTNEKYGILKRLQNEINKLKEKVEKEDKSFEENPWINDYINDNPGKTVDEYLKVIRQKLKEKEYEIIKKENAKLKTIANEVRDRLRRLKIQSSRSHYNHLQFLGSIQTSKRKDVDQLIEKKVRQIEKILRNTKRKNGRIAVIGAQQKIYDTEHIHKSGENTLFDKYSVRNGRATRSTQSVPKKQVEQWYKENLDIEITLIPDWEPEEYEIIGILKPAYVPNTKNKWKEKTSKKTVSHEVDAGSLLAATYFYTLVSNTPIDEPYTIRDNGRKTNYWDRARIALKKNSKDHRKQSENKTLQEIVEELKEKESKITKTRYKNTAHVPDEESVRGDWVLYFRGKTFKAFKSTPASNSGSVSDPIYFNEEDFMDPVTDSAMGDLNSVFNTNGKIKNTNFKPYIWHIAEVIAKNTDTNSNDMAIKVENINPRWQILEYGGYKSDKSGPWKGSGKYGRQHGVDEEGFSYQAPRGFKRIVDAQYNAIMTKSALYNKAKSSGDVGSSTAYTRANRSLDWNMDITRMNESQFSELMNKLIDEDKTLSIENIHTIDGNKVWRWEEIK